MKKIKLFPAPHMEVRVFVSDEMEKDFVECRRKTGKGKIPRIPNCDKCSWEELEKELYKALSVNHKICGF